MKPDDEVNSHGGSQLSRPRFGLSKRRTYIPNRSQEAAANIVRMQLDHIYEKGDKEDSPYERTYTEEPVKTHTKDWKEYHTAWQNYYQKYYEGYYKLHFENDKKAKSSHYFTQPEPELQAVSEDEALKGIHREVIDKIKKSATKVRKSRHFIPILSGIIVVLIFLFLQFNQLIVANVLAYVSPGSIDPQNIVVDPNADLTVPPDPKLIIPKINVDVPVFYDVGTDYKSQMSAMAKGVAQFKIPGADAHPGEVGNTVISGHSSNDLFDSGDYKFIFAQLEKLQPGDTIYLNYQSKRYTYTTTKREVVGPSDVNKLVYNGDKPILTLITCTPLGTSLNRLLITAEQVSPDPLSAKKVTPTNTPDTKSIPGNTPSFLEKLLGIKS